MSYRLTWILVGNTFSQLSCRFRTVDQSDVLSRGAGADCDQRQTARSAFLATELSALTVASDSLNQAKSGNPIALCDAVKALSADGLPIPDNGAADSKFSDTYAERKKIERTVRDAQRVGGNGDISSMNENIQKALDQINQMINTIHRLEAESGSPSHDGKGCETPRTLLRKHVACRTEVLTGVRIDDLDENRRPLRNPNSPESGLGNRNRPGDLRKEYLVSDALDFEAADHAGLEKLARERLARALTAASTAQEKSLKRYLRDNPYTSQWLCAPQGGTASQPQIECTDVEDTRIEVLNQMYSHQTDMSDNVACSAAHAVMAREAVDVQMPKSEELFCYLMVDMSRKYTASFNYIENHHAEQDKFDRGSYAKSGYASISPTGLRRLFGTSRSATWEESGWYSTSSHFEKDDNANISFYNTYYLKSGTLIFEKSQRILPGLDSLDARQTACQSAQRDYMAGRQEDDIPSDCYCSWERVVPATSILSYRFFPRL